MTKHSPMIHKVLTIAQQIGSEDFLELLRILGFETQDKEKTINNINDAINNLYVNTPAILIVIDTGDPIIKNQWKIECPFLNGADNNIKQVFSSSISAIYTKLSKGEIITFFEE